MADEKTQQSVEQLAADLPNLGTTMHLFSLSMRSLYCEEKVSESVEHGKEFISLRDKTRNDAVAYLRCVMPLTETCVLKLQEYFSYYECLKFDEWEECVPDILEEVEAYRGACNALVKIHNSFCVTLKKRKDKATELCGQFKDLQAQYERDIKALRKSAQDKNFWAVPLVFVPYVGVIVSPLLVASGMSDVTKAVAKRGQQQIMFAASKSVSEVLMPAMDRFIKGLEIVAGFFNIVHNELESFDDKMEKRKKLHYKMLRRKAGEIKAGCRAFHGLLPAVKTDFQAIPTEGTNENYVDRWLKKQNKIISETCNKTSRKFLTKALKAVGGSK